MKMKFIIILIFVISILFSGSFCQDELPKKDKIYLLKLARQTLQSYLKTGKKTNIDKKTLSPYLKSSKGCFVTLHVKKNHALRGCIGYITPRGPLYQSVIENSINAALNDYRFNKVTYKELNKLELEISVLTIPRKLEYQSVQELLKKLIPLKHGVIIKTKHSQSTYLPQVWQQITNKEDFLSHLCRKQGVSPDCWKDPDTMIEVYQAIVFNESQLLKN